MKTVSIIVLCWNNLPHTRRCLESIFQYARYPDLEILVVDNHSTDGTADYLRSLSPKHPELRCIFNDQNVGFAAGNNLAIKQATGEYLILLNNDTVVTEHWVHGLVKYFDDPAVGMVGPVSNNVGNEAKVILPFTTLDEMHRAAKAYATANRNRSFEISMVGFFCVAIRRAVIDAVGLLDERFGFGMFEDDDYCLRVRETQYKIVCAEDVFIYHHGRASFEMLTPYRHYRTFIKNKKYFEAKWNRRWNTHFSGLDHVHALLQDTRETSDRLSSADASLESYFSRQTARLQALDEILEVREHNPYDSYGSLLWKIYRLHQRAWKLYKKAKKMLPDRWKDNIRNTYRQWKNYPYYRAQKKTVADRLDQILDATPSRQGIITFFSVHDWNYPLFQRPHQLALALAKQKYLVFYHTPNRLDLVRDITKVNDFLHIVADHRFLKKLSGVVFLTNHPPRAKFISSLDTALVVYDFLDDLEVNKAYGQRYVRQHQRLLKQADLVTVTSAALEAQARTYNSSVTVVPNGVDFTHFASSGTGKCPSDLWALIGDGKPVIGYYGAFGDWIDFSLVKTLARRFNDCHLILLGADFLGNIERHGLPTVENIHWLGPKKYSELPDYVRYFDVAIIPFCRGPIADATSPVKLFEYMAAGIPIVTTAMRECEKFPEVIVSATPEAFCDNVGRAMQQKKDPAFRTVLRQTGQQQTWDRWVQIMISAMRAAAANRAKP